jgi:hypothetical protein
MSAYHTLVAFFFLLNISCWSWAAGQERQVLTAVGTGTDTLFPATSGRGDPMQQYLVALLLSVTSFGQGKTVSTDDTVVNEILDKAMKAMGGEDKLSKIQAATWKAKGKITLADSKEYEFTSQTTTQGLDRARTELQIEHSGRQLKILAVLNGDKAFYKIGNTHLQPNVAVAHLKRAVYLAVIPVTLAPLKEQAFKVKAGGEEKVDGRPAVVLKVTCPGGSDFTISFDKESGLPVKAVGKVFTLNGPEVTEETTYGDYKDFGGIKAATRLDFKFDGKSDRKQEVTDFIVLDKVDPLAFSIPMEAAAQGQEASTIPGPETDKLLPATTGYVLFAFGGDKPDGIADGDIIAVELPTLKDTIVRPRPRQNQVDMPNIHALSGPDAEGRIAYIEDHFFVADEKMRRHLLKIIRLDGTHDTELFSRPGDAMWATSGGHGEIGSDLTLSQVGGRVAFLSGLVNVQMPSAFLHVGSVEIWDVHNKARVKPTFKALEGLAWFPDGTRMAYVKFIDPKVAAASVLQTDSFGQSFRRWNKVPAVFIRDVDAETESFLHIGWHPVVSFDGQSVLVNDNENAWKRVDVATGKSESTTWPGLWSPIASPTKDVVLSLCLPTQGASVRFTKHNSTLVGPKEMLSLKLAIVNANEFQTVVSHIDPRTKISFGQIKQKKAK